MKTTKDAYFRQHPEWQQRENISGCFKFDGEDYDYEQRQKKLQQTQKQWLDEKVKENQIKKEQELYEEQNFARQQKELNEMRYKLEKDHNQKRKDMALAEKETDSLLEKKDKEFEEKQRRLEEERRDLELCKSRAQKLNGKVSWQGLSQVVTKTQSAMPNMTETKILY